MSPWYLTSCFPLAFLEGQQSTLVPKSAFLYLGPAIWDPSASFSSILSQMILQHSFSSSSSPPQPFSSWLPPLLLSLLPSLLSKLCIQSNVTLPLLPVESGAATTPCVSVAFLAAAFQAFQH